MEQNKFLEMVKSTEKSVIALDFDGVIRRPLQGIRRRNNLR